jgi:hypothetical protein
LKRRGRAEDKVDVLALSGNEELGDNLWQAYVSAFLSVGIYRV